MRCVFVCLGVGCALFLSVSSAHGAVTSWLSLSNLLDGTAAPSDPDISATGGDTGTLYVWAHNTAQLDSLAYDVTTSDPTKVMITASEMFNPAVLVTGTRWDLPVTHGTIDADGNLANMYGFALTTQGLSPATRDLAPPTGDAGWDAAANGGMGAGLIAQIQYSVKGAACMSGCMDVPVTLSLGDGMFGTVSAGATETTTNGFATIMVAMEMGETNPPVVGDLGPLTTSMLNEKVSGMVPLSGGAVTSLDFDDVANPMYTPGFGADVGDPTLSFGVNPTLGLDGMFMWDTTGARRGTYAWDITGSNADGMDGGLITAEVTQVPEPASLALAGLAMIGLVGLVRRRG